MIVLLPLMFAAAPVSGGDGRAPERAIRVATATVTIIQPERISPSIVEADAKPDRQIRRREQKPLVEFF
jgi:hypothetical protein